MAFIQICRINLSFHGKMINSLLTVYKLSGTIDDVEKVHKTRFIHESNENYPKVVLHVYPENEHDIKRNEAVLNDLPGERHTIEPNDKIRHKYPLAAIQAAQNQQNTNIGGLVKLFKIKIGAKIMLTVNADI